MGAILIVDERTPERDALRSALVSAGHSVIEASDATAALAAVRFNAPNLIISALLVPSVDGLELVRQVRTLPGGLRIPVLFCTREYEEADALEVARRCGVSDVLRRPDDILRRVDVLLAQSPHDVPVAPDFDRAHASFVSSKLTAKLEELQACHERIRSVVMICQRIASEQSAAALLDTVCRDSIGLLGANACTLGILSPDGHDIEAYVTAGDESLCGATVRGETVRRVVAGLETLRGDGVHDTHLVVPLVSSTRAYGWLGFYNAAGSTAFTHGDEIVARLLGVYAATAYENARRFEALRVAEERSGFALAAARMGTWEIAVETGRVNLSESVAALFGRRPADLPDTLGDVLLMVHADDRPRVAAAIAAAIRNRTTCADRFRAVWADGSVRWLNLRGRVLIEDGRCRFFAVVIDITDQKRLEHEFQQAQKMEAIGRLAGSVAHDFNNVLTAIVGYSNFASEAAVSDVQRSDIDQIVAAADRGAHLTQQLLEYTRKQVLEPTLVNLDALLEDMAPLLRTLVGEQVTILTDLSAAAPAVSGDAGQLEQVVMNLVVNARDAMPHGGTITLATANVSHDDGAGRQRTYVRLTVRDTGIGMDAATKARLFEPFFTTKPTGRGTGLGLSTVAAIVKQNGGSVSVDSEPGRGTAFFVDFRCADAAKGTTHRASIDSPHGHGEVVLLVEDEATVRAIATTMLTRCGYRVVAAATAEDAVERVRGAEDDVAILVTDVVLPGASGPELLQRLRLMRPTLKALYISGYASDAVRAEAARDANVRFLQKPFAPAALVRHIREFLDLTASAAV